MFKIFAPSYKRSKGKSTHHIIPDITYVVSESEKESYLTSGEHDKFWFVPPSAQGNLCRIRNYILDNANSKKILLLDDDHTRIGMWSCNKRIILNQKQIIEFISNSFDMSDDYNIKFWGILPNNDKLSYRESAPFSLSSYIGGPWQAFNECELRYDEKLPLKEDYDMTLQALNKYRRILRINYVHYFPKQHNNSGGCAVYRNIEFEKQQLKDLQKKWGSKIIKSGSIGKSSAMGSKTKEAIHDINPIIKVPLKGI